MYLGRSSNNGKGKGSLPNPMGLQAVIAFGITGDAKAYKVLLCLSIYTQSSLPY